MFNEYILITQILDNAIYISIALILATLVLNVKLHSIITKLAARKEHLLDNKNTEV